MRPSQRRRRPGFVSGATVMEFHDRKLVFLDGPGLVVELAEWLTSEA